MQDLSLASPLPLRWDPERDPDHARRRHIGGIQLSDRALERFNSVLSTNDLGHRQLCADQIATGARFLFTEPQLPVPPCIYDRLRATALLRRMSRDSDWEPEPDAAECVDRLLQYFADSDVLIPHWAPVVGHFDDAILVDAAWPRLAHETACYQDYRRVRRAEAELRGADPATLGFKRDDWLAAREAAERLMRRFRGQGYESYRHPHGGAPFRVH
jgi:hypothetical protein